MLKKIKSCNYKEQSWGSNPGSVSPWPVLCHTLDRQNNLYLQEDRNEESEEGGGEIGEDFTCIKLHQEGYGHHPL